MDTAIKAGLWRKSVGVVLLTLFLELVGGYEISLQKLECISYFLERHGNTVSGSFMVVEERLDLYSYRTDVEMEVRGPSGNKILSVKAEGGEKFQFKVLEVGHFKICFSSTSASPKKVDFTIQVGQIPNPKDLVEDVNFDPLEEKVEQLRAALERVSLEQQYYKARSVRHRHTNESTQNRLLWYTVIEYLSLIVVSLAQIYLVQTHFSRRIGCNSL